MRCLDKRCTQFFNMCVIKYIYVCICVCTHMHSVMTNSLRSYGLQPAMEFPRQEYWGRLPFPPPGDLPNPGIEPRLLHVCVYKYIQLVSEKSSSSGLASEILLSSAVTGRPKFTYLKKYGMLLLSLKSRSTKVNRRNTKCRNGVRIK